MQGSKGRSQRACPKAIPINQVREDGGSGEEGAEEGATERVRRGSVLDMFFHGFIKVQLAFDELANEVENTPL